MKNIFKLLLIISIISQNLFLCEEFEFTKDDILDDNNLNQQAIVEVKVTPPKSTQPQIQKKINDLEANRKNNELNYLQAFKKTFENEIIVAGKQIEDIVNKTMDLFNDQRFFNASGNYQEYSPMTFVKQQDESGSVTYKVQQELYKPPNKTNLNPIEQAQFKEIDPPTATPSNEPIQNSVFQPDKLVDLHIDIPSEEDIMKMMADPSPEVQKRLDMITKQLAYLVSKGEQGPAQNKNQKPRPTSFLQLSADDTGGESFTVKFHQAKDIDPELVDLIEALEQDRGKIEESIFNKANDELKQITKQTIEELKYNLEIQLLPIFMISNNIHINQDTVFNSKMEILSLVQILDKYGDKIREFFPVLSSKIDDLRRESLDIPVITSPFDDFSTPNVKIIEQYNREFNSIFFGNETEQQPKPVSFIQQKLKPISFVQLSQKSNNFLVNNLNLKLSSDVAYPTIFKKIALMEAIRDNTERKEMDKIIQIETHLQKIQCDMIQSALSRAIPLMLEKIKKK